MDTNKYENAHRLGLLFTRLAKSDWRKITKWSIKASEVRLLFVIKRHVDAGNKGIAVSDISKQLQVTSPTVTQMINNLIKYDYVTRSVHPVDRRITEIALTEKGEKLAVEATQLFKSMFEGLIDFLGKEESDHLIKLLENCFIYFDQLEKDK